MVLNKKLSTFLLCSEDNIQLLNGAAQVYPLLSRIFENKRVLIPNPTFGEYSRVFDVNMTYKDDENISNDDIRSKIPNNDVVVIVNPNNPTGSEVSTLEILDLASKWSDKFFIVDESFIEFSSESSLIDLLEKRSLDNILILKSLSKSWGVPGVRIGYVYSSNKRIMKDIRDNTPIWNSNSIAEFILELMLKNRDSLKKPIANTIEDREQFVTMLKSLDITRRIFKSGANFVLVELVLNKPETIQLANNLLINNNIFIKQLNSRFEGESGYVRLAVRHPHENKRLVDFLSRLSI